MRLLDVRDLTFYEPPPDETPKYAIASHRWKWGEEVYLKDIQKRRDTHKSGYKTIEGFARYVRDHFPEIQYLWADTCCIKQSSDREVSEAVNSMFRYYRDAAVCLAYLADVHSPGDMTEFRNSVWHTRGWALQELIAPRKVIFLTSDWRVIGCKSDDGNSNGYLVLQQSLAQVTSIPEDVIADYQVAARLSIEEKLHWTTFRNTTLPEDAVYSLFGIFDVAMPVIYGEGVVRPRRRLFAAVGQADPDLHRLPTAVLPHGRDPDHVDRPELQEQIDRILSVKSARVALVGVHGVGKTQLALEDAYKTRALRPQTWVLWIDASTQHNLERSAEEVARRIRIPGHEAVGINFSRLLQNWLSDEKNGTWVLILDSPNRIGTLLETGLSLTRARGWLEHIPVCEHGSVLATGRSDCESRDFAYGWRFINVPPLDFDPAARLLNIKLGDGFEPDEVFQLARALFRTPLKLSEAALCIRERGPQYPLRQHVENIQFEQELRTAMERLRNDRRSAADLLALMSLCDSQAIPKFLVCYEDGGSLPGLVEDTFRGDIPSLQDLCLISTTDEASTWQMQSKTQDVISKLLSKQQGLERCKARFARCLDKVTPTTAEFENRAACRQLLPHAKRALHLKPNDGTVVDIWAQVLHTFSYYTMKQGHYQDAEQFAKASFEAREAQLGLRNAQTLKSASALAYLYHHQRRYQDACDLLERGLPVSKDLMGEKDIQTLDIMEYLAMTYSSLGEHEEAVSMQEKNVELQKEAYGLEEPGTLTAMHNLAWIYTTQGKHQDAGQLLEKTIAMKKVVWGEGHPNTLLSLNGMARNLTHQGRHEEATQLTLQVLHARSRIFSPDHLDIISSTYDLACCYNDVERFEEAKELLLGVLDKRARALGPDYQATISAATELRYAQRKLLTQIMAPRKAQEEAARSTFVPRHPGIQGENATKFGFARPGTVPERKPTVQPLSNTVARQDITELST